MSVGGLKAVVFDLDNTLYNEGEYFKAVVSHFLNKNHHFEIDLDSLIDIGARLKSKDYLGDILHKLSLYSERKQEQLFDLYCGFSGEVPLDPAVSSMLKILRRNSMQIGMVTNGVVIAQRNKVRCLSLEVYLDAITYARDLGKSCEKPHAAPFVDICQKLNCVPENTLFVGDHPVNDIIGAKNIGMMTAWLKKPYFDRPEQADIVLNSVDELIGKIVDET